MVGVNKDNFKVLVNTVLVDPVRVEYPKISTAPPDTLLSRTPQASLVLEVVDTLSYRLTEGSTYEDFNIDCLLDPGEMQRTLGDGLFPVTTTNSDTINDVSLLGLVP